MIIYKSRYLAKKNMDFQDYVVKVDGGWAVMSAQEYYTWKNQK